MPRHCPSCGRIPERNRYLTSPPKDAPKVVAGMVMLAEIQVWECTCGWAEDVDLDFDPPGEP